MTCTHFRHPTDEQLQHSYIFSNYYNLQSVHLELVLGHISPISQLPASR